ncbi:hypothetical protein CEXT_271321 [Caerostris extrusa]|uniref:Uncharacterized protein n=1 Tax=Caerostris extrusa TaxID=172846 RepID=A0AAV4WZ90_CAEEX|nr:hypothetical protein CEXT_271321 [Caerostris extrusa]
MDGFKRKHSFERFLRMFLLSVKSEDCNDDVIGDKSRRTCSVLMVECDIWQRKTFLARRKQKTVEPDEEM